MSDKTIFLLDLNYTLVANSKDIKYLRPYEKKINAETYRDWLIDLIKDYYVILITARPDSQKEETLLSFNEKIIDWQPNEMYFQEENDTPPIAKEKLLKKYIFPKHGVKGNYFAIESNPKTKVMYEKYNIPAVSVGHDEGLNFREELKIISKFENFKKTIPLHKFIFFYKLNNEKKTFFKNLFEFLEDNGFYYKAGLDKFTYFFNINNNEISILELSNDKNHNIKSKFRGFKKIQNGEKILKNCVDEVLKIENATEFGFGFKIKIDDNLDENDFDILKKAIIKFKKDSFEYGLL